jgi:hypothetical protein
MKQLSLITSLALLTASGAHAAVNLAVDQALGEVFGTTRTVASAGSPDNYQTFTGSEVVYFRLSGDDGNGNNAFTVDMTISVNGSSGAGFGSNKGQIMLSQTTNSQGYTDTGSVSLLLNPSIGGHWTVDLGIEFFAVDDVNTNPFDTTLGTKIGLPFQLTSLDLDFDQFTAVNTSQFDTYQVSTTTKLEASTDNGLLRLQDTSGVAAAFTDRDNAVSFFSDGAEQTYHVQVGHDAVALYVLEFRNPPLYIDYDNPVTAVPEPSSYALILGVAAFTLLSLKRRRA